MSKTYSNRALPSGTVLREWRLEEVLGVGGFGIVYKGRGIYFDELVAIKEYFPGSISERDAEDTVVPIDSDAEEVHALGLKKFVEEAKLLWNLSTPTRHPNIVNVRSLFEVHGTAYMVMDFEDGVSLSRLLKEGRRFNERSLLNIIQPIAQGLDRAHRVGVLHRDIKPPNILINPDGRPVLIDFGSARFESGDATSTKVTFHTPPYAAIEQYMKTYEQGPWTDIYALGVVLYECIAGEKPPEVLERLHGGQGKALADGHWPGYSPRFLAGVDAAMTIRPVDRPRSISEWLGMFEDAPIRTQSSTVEVDEDATRFAVYDKSVEEIQPVAPRSTTSTPVDDIETRVPHDPSDAEFKIAGRGQGAKKPREPVALVPPVETAAMATTPPANGKAEKAADPIAPKRSPSASAAEMASSKPRKRLSPVLLGGGGLAIVAAAGGGWLLLGREKTQPSPDISIATPQLRAQPQPSTPTELNVAPLTSDLNSLANDARAAGTAASVVDPLVAASNDITIQASALSTATPQAAHTGADTLRAAAATAEIKFADALLRQSEAHARHLSSSVPWAHPLRGRATHTPTADQRGIAERLKSTLLALRATVQGASTLADPAQTIGAARQALGQSQAFAAATAAAYRQNMVAKKTEAAVIPRTPKLSAAVAPAVSALTSAPETAPSSQGGGVSGDRLSQFQSIVADGRGMASRVMHSGARGDAAKANAQLARNYDKYLVALKDSMRGVKSNAQADRMIAQAKQTRAYLVYLVQQSGGSK